MFARFDDLTHAAATKFVPTIEENDRLRIAAPPDLAVFRGIFVIGII